MANKCMIYLSDISIHPLRGEWDDADTKSKYDLLRISIHPLRGEWDSTVYRTNNSGKKFQSTHSVGSGTKATAHFCDTETISIHPLRGEWDHAAANGDARATHFNPPTPWGVGHCRQVYTALVSHFNPPTPWGVGLNLCLDRHKILTFQSTHSVGSGTAAGMIFRRCGKISIHPLRGEWDGYDRPPSPCQRFQSTHSVGSGTMHFRHSFPPQVFQSTHSVGSGTRRQR